MKKTFGLMLIWFLTMFSVSFAETKVVTFKAKLGDCYNSVGCEMSLYAKIYNPTHSPLTVKFSFLDIDEMQLDDHERTSTIFPELFTQNGDTTIFRDNGFVSNSTILNMKSYSIKVLTR